MSFFKDLNNNLTAKVNESEEVVETTEVEEVNESQEETTEEVNEEVVVKLEEGESFLDESITLSICNECGSLHENAEGTCTDCNEGILEEAMKMVVRDGKVVKKKIKRAKRLTGKQKQALAKAQKKAHTASATKSRAKSMKVRSKRIKEAEEFACPECDYVGEMKYDAEEECYICPECGACLEIADEACGNKKKMNESLEAYKEILDIPSNVINEGDDSVVQYLNDEFGIVIE